MKKTAPYSITLAVLLALLAIPGCFYLAKGPPPEAINIVFSADTKAELYECG
jgi:hypothetical protein